MVVEGLEDVKPLVQMDTPWLVPALKHSLVVLRTLHNVSAQRFFIHIKQLLIIPYSQVVQTQTSAVLPTKSAKERQHVVQQDK